MRAFRAGLAMVVITGAALSAQAPTSPAPDRVKVDVAGGMSRYGPHTFGGLEVAMNRWLAVRGEALFGLHNRRELPSYRHTALSMTSVLTYNRDARLVPYAFGGFGVSVSQGYQPGIVPIAGGGLRFKLGRFEPFIEARTQRPIGVPLSFGIRF